MLALVIGVSCVGLVAATCLAQCWASKTVKERTDIILQNINTNEKLIEEPGVEVGEFEFGESRSMLSVI